MTTPTKAENPSAWQAIKAFAIGIAISAVGGSVAATGMFLVSVGAVKLAFIGDYCPPTPWFLLRRFVAICITISPLFGLWNAALLAQRSKTNG